MELAQQTFSLQAYLEWENVQPERHEFYRGEVFPMTAHKRLHGCVCANLIKLFGNHLSGTTCQIFSASLKVQITDDTVLYPDIFCHL